MRAIALWAAPGLASALSLQGCRSVAPEQVLSRAPVVVAPVPSAVVTGPWIYRAASRRTDYVVDQQAQLVFREDTLTRTDSVSSHAELHFVISAPAGRTSGEVTVFHAEARGRSAVVPPGLGLPFPFSGVYLARAGQLSFLAPSAAPCLSPALSVMHGLRDLWFWPPDTLRLGTGWEDSTSFAVCRDGVPLRARAVRTFRVTAAERRDGRTFLVVLRTAQTTIVGEGAQSGEPVTVSGTGHGELTYTLDPAEGSIVEGRGSSALELTLRSRLRTQTVRQDVALRLARVP